MKEENTKENHNNQDHFEVLTKAKIKQQDKANN